MAAKQVKVSLTELEALALVRCIEFTFDEWPAFRDDFRQAAVRAHAKLDAARRTPILPPKKRD